MTTPPAPPCQLPAWATAEPGLDRLLDNVQVQLPAVPTDVVMLQAWNTIEDFYMRSTLRREHVYWKMDPGVMTINFDPWDAHWRSFMFIQFNGLSNPKFEGPCRLRDLTHPPPTNERKGEVLIALKPKDLSTPLPYEIWTQWFDTLLSGTMARLQMTPAKPYSDPRLGAYNGGVYRSGIASARAQAQSGDITDGVLW